MPLSRALRRLFHGKDHEGSPPGGRKPSTGSSRSKQEKGEASEPEDYGLEVLAAGAEPVVDIIAIHGLKGHKFRSWTQTKPGKGKEEEVLWLRDLLPTELPNARILTWGYDARVLSWCTTSREFIQDHARALVNDLVLDRQLHGITERPIIFVTHSLGGLVVKNALILSHLSNPKHNLRNRAIKVSTYGIIFLGTPHQGGSGVTFAQTLARIASVAASTNLRVLKSLEPDSSFLTQQIEQFASISQDFDTKFAYEMYPMNIWGYEHMVVPKSSAVLLGTPDTEIFGIHANHVEMNRFASKENKDYQGLCGRLQLMVREAVPKIRSNWSEEASVSKVPIHARSQQPVEQVQPQRSSLEICIEWLKYPGFGECERRIPHPFPGTLEWIASHKDIQPWLKSGKGIFWISGKPGSGKSVLMKHLCTCAKEERGFAYFYSHPTSGAGDNVQEFLQAYIIKALSFNSHLFTHVEQAFTEQDASIETLTTAFRALVRAQASEYTLCFFVDAIECCNGTSRSFLGLLEGILDMDDALAQQILICVSSRPTSDGDYNLERYPGIVVEDHNAAGLSLFTWSKLAEVPQLTLEKAERVHRKLIALSDGMFLWTRIIVTRLDVDWKALSEELFSPCFLDKYPEELALVYGTMLGQIPDGSRSEASIMFKCVMAEARPLTLWEFRIAVAFGSPKPPETLLSATQCELIQKDDRDLESHIQNCTGGLLEIRRPSMTVHFIHFTAKAFLKLEESDEFESMPFGSPETGHINEECHDILFSSCRNMLNMPELQNINITFGGDYAYWEQPIDIPIGQLKALHFLPYAVEFWTLHFRKGSSSSLREFYDEEASGGRKSEVFTTWFKLYCHTCRPGWRGQLPSFRIFAALHGLSSRVESDILTVDQRRGWSFDRVDELQNAILGHNSDFATHLMRRINTKTRRTNELRFQSPIALAITFNKGRELLIKDLESCVQGSRLYFDICDHIPGAPYLSQRPIGAEPGCESPPSQSYIYSGDTLLDLCDQVDFTWEEQERFEDVLDMELRIRDVVISRSEYPVNELERSDQYDRTRGPSDRFTRTWGIEYFDLEDPMGLNIASDDDEQLSRYYSRALVFEKCNADDHVQEMKKPEASWERKQVDDDARSDKTATGGGQASDEDEFDFS